MKIGMILSNIFRSHSQFSNMVVAQETSDKSKAFKHSFQKGAFMMVYLRDMCKKGGFWRVASMQQHTGDWK